MNANSELLRRFANSIPSETTIDLIKNDYREDYEFLQIIVSVLSITLKRES